jgi:hypothetical protein
VLYVYLLCAVSCIAIQDTPDQKWNLWVSQWKSDSFQQREEASKKLLGAGRDVIPILAKAALSSDVETSSRAVQILLAFNDSEDERRKSEALKTLLRLAESDHACATKIKKSLSPSLVWIRVIGAEFYLYETLPHRHFFELRL